MVKTGFSGKDIPNNTIIDACVHCGLCLSSCPTYRQTGLEMSSPRGRIYLMKAVTTGTIGLESHVFQHQMTECLNCRACEAVCPSGVLYGHILEASRAQVEQARKGEAEHPTPAVPPRPLWQQLIRRVVFNRLFVHMELFRAFSRAMALYQRSGVQWLVRKSGLLHVVRMQDMEAMLPVMSKTFTIPKGQIYPAEGESRYLVGLFTGCIMGTAFAHVHDATIRVLQKNGCDVVLVPDQGCCGALHTHSGDLEGGRALARRTIAAFEGMGLDAIIANAAGCGSTLKEYGELLHDDPQWRERAVQFSALVQDVHEFLTAIDLNRDDLGLLPVRVTYQEACHLAHAQRIIIQPRKLLKAIPGVDLHEMRESALCCGSAGVYNITQPEMAYQLGKRKVNHALETNTTIIATTNPGCAIQMSSELQRRGEHVEVRYIVELLDESYRNPA